MQRENFELRGELYPTTRRAYPPTIPVAPTITRRFWLAAESFIDGPQAVEKRSSKKSG